MNCFYYHAPLVFALFPVIFSVNVLEPSHGRPLHSVKDELIFLTGYSRLHRLAERNVSERVS